ncbi:MAG: glycosyltransferase [Tannerella sp.]|jgi:glycosyltransferase involved in cell wall biosynthesis|nr:glycosyltransferase [Tannerella sp.]
MQLSLVIPCYNEGEILPSLLRRLDALTTERPDMEIILVDNGSSDATTELVRSAPERNSCIVPVRVETNKGYGHGILQGLKTAGGEFLGWTQGDMQTDPMDVLRALKILEKSDRPARLYLKGKRCARTAGDRFFTCGMSIMESLLFQQPFWDINGQPNVFHRSFYENWENPPSDFALELYVYAAALRSGLNIVRFPVLIQNREYGTSRWNINIMSRLQLIQRILKYSFQLRMSLHKNDSSNF